MENRSHLTKKINIQEYDFLIDQNLLTINILISYSLYMYFRDSIEILSPGRKHYINDSNIQWISQSEGEI